MLDLTKVTLNPKILDQIYADLVGDLEIEGSEFKNYFDSLLINTILQVLEPDSRKRFLTLIQENQLDQLDKFLTPFLPKIEQIMKEKLLVEVNKLKDISSS
ncbi:MAG TPA: hypothetical protein DEP87_01970 [Candidatus Pacebacteria bacterium]|nr:hypothetical protein [Candidatus Paceibacterota bacterium]